MELSQLDGIGKTRLQALHAAGIDSLRELLYAVPVSYKDLSRPLTVAEVQPGASACLCLNRRSEARLSRHGRLSRVTCTFADETGQITACWFNQPWMRDHLNNALRLTLYGRVEAYGGRKQLQNPSVEHELCIVPTYRPIEGLPQRVHRSIVAQALQQVEALCPETLSDAVRQRYGLWPWPRAIRALHAPQSMDEAKQAGRRFAFEQMLLYQAAVRSMRTWRGQAPAIASDAAALEAYWASLPFAPTAAQRRTLAQIACDMAQNRAMARMVQGDVGSGKTAVAMGAMLLCAQAGYQCALMAPTDILARQHYRDMRPYFEARGLGCGLLVSGMPAAQRRQALENLRNGTWRVIVGTHALIGKGVVYDRLALCITDEQHRFGVAQRTALMQKGSDGRRAPHLLVMSATPIPRSLALVMFGDLDLSLIDELPPGRTPVTTRIVPDERRADLYAFVRREAQAGRQAFVVCPLATEGEGELKSARAYAQELAAGPLKGLRVGLTYGAQPQAEKEAALDAFAQGQTQVLVSTTVVEVGINVPNATLMIVEDAQRYGLAQLHQLRGRVGRGSLQSWCFLLAQPNDRLRALAATNDGFEVARADLEQRGPGELLGTRQHGEALMPGGAAAYGDLPLLYAAAECARELEGDPARAEEWREVSRRATALVERLSERVSIS